MPPIFDKSPTSASFDRLDDFLKIVIRVTPVALSSSFVWQQYTCKVVVVVVYREIVLGSS